MIRTAKSAQQGQKITAGCPHPATGPDKKQQGSPAATSHFNPFTPAKIHPSGQLAFRLLQAVAMDEHRQIN
jgi:hypothetical protein